jgi:hypothetical protein
MEGDDGGHQQGKRFWLQEMSIKNVRARFAGGKERKEHRAVNCIPRMLAINCNCLAAVVSDLNVFVCIDERGRDATISTTLYPVYRNVL